MFEGGTGRRKVDAIDGADQTALLLKLDRSVPWTKPQDAVVTEGKPLKVEAKTARVCGFCTVDDKARSLDQFGLLGGNFEVSALLTRAGGEAKVDIDKAIAAAGLAAGHDKLNFVELWQLIFQQAGVDVPTNLPPPLMKREP
jgi:hypothetical protein